MRFIFLALCLLFTSAHAVESSGALTSASFTSTTAEIPNQERGFYGGLTGTSPYFYVNDADSGSLNSTFNAGRRLVIGVLYLGAYVNTDTIDSGFITNLTNKFALIRAAHVKVVLRPAYNYALTPGTDTTVARMTLHMQQLKQVLYDNADVIAFVQTGLVAGFGEWYYSATFGVGFTPASQGAAMKLVHQAVLSNIHPRLTASLRYPRFLNNFYATQLTSLAAFSGSEQARSGIHNDCMGADNQDGGTFTSSTLTPISANAERLRLSQDSNYHPYGGEACLGNAQRFTCSATSGIMFDGPTYHLTYMNGVTNSAPAFFSGTAACQAELSRMMGYRFQYDAISHQGTAAAGQTLTFNVDLRNYGWARIFSERRVQVRLMSGTTVAASAMSAADLRKLPPQATASTRIPVKGLVAPADGTYAVELCIPDVWASLQSDVNYKVRNANADAGGQQWNATTGCWKTGTQVVVGSGPVAMTTYDFKQSWSPTEGGAYNGYSGSITNGAKANLQTAINLVTALGKTPVVATVLFSLGFNDQLTTAAGSRTGADVSAFVSQIRTDFPTAAPSALTRYAISRPGPYGTSSTTIRSAFAAIASGDPKVTVIDTDAFPRSTALDAYNVHFTIAGYDAVGAAAYDASDTSGASDSAKGYILYSIGDSNANGQAQDDPNGPNSTGTAAGISGYSSSANIKILTSSGTFATYAPSTSPNTGITGWGGSASNTTASELGYIRKFRIDHPSSNLYVVKLGNGGSFGSRGTSTGTFTGTISGSVLTVTSGSYPSANSLIVGAGVPTGTYVSSQISGATFRVYPAGSSTPANITVP